MNGQRTETASYVRYLNRAPKEGARCIVFDLDDTLAKYDPELTLRRCDAFEPTELVKVANAARRHGYEIVVASARPHFCSFASWHWLRLHGVDAAAVYLRNGNVREYKAHEVKTEMFKDILNKWSVENFYDDSPANVAAAKDLGINATFVPGNESYWAANPDG